MWEAQPTAAGSADRSAELNALSIALDSLSKDLEATDTMNDFNKKPIKGGPSRPSLGWEPGIDFGGL
jgi:hypothetical protein